MKVGDYVITKDRLHIGKIYNINDFREPSMRYAIDFPKQDDFIFMGEDDFKSSPNIIDLIEEDDFINGSRITELKSNKNGVIKCMLDSDYEFITTIINEEIESVVTKEQFSQMEYKIKEK